MIDTEPMVTRLRLAADYLHEHGWTRGAERRADGRVCLTGAIRYCAPQSGDEYLISEVLRKRDRAEHWNDSLVKTAAEVEDYLRTAEVTDEDLAETFGPQWEQIVALIRTMFTLTAEQWERLDAHRNANRTAILEASHKAMAASRNASRAASWRASWTAIRDAGQVVSQVAGTACLDTGKALCARDLIGQHGFTQEHYDTLTGPWRRVVGKLHPDDAPMNPEFDLAQQEDNR